MEKLHKNAIRVFAGSSDAASDQLREPRVNFLGKTVYFCVFVFSASIVLVFRCDSWDTELPKEDHFEKLSCARN